MKISIIATVKNEASNIAPLLDSMLAQSRPADEIVINDNGSRDATVALVERYIQAGHPIRLVHGGHNIPSGRNNAIRHAHGPLIASCDAGLTLPPEWLAALVAPLEAGADVAAGFYVAAPESLWELALGATNYPDVEEIDPEQFLPAGQSVAFTKAAWEAVGGYPEWADTCEDLLFDLELKRRRYRFAFVPEAAVRFRPRETVRAYLRQYYTYARGDGVGRLWFRRHVARYAFYLGLLGIGAFAWRNRLATLLALPPLGFHLWRPLRRTWRRSRELSLAQRAAVLALVPLIRLLGDAAKMVGYPVGVWLRLSGRAGPSAAPAEREGVQQERAMAAMGRFSSGLPDVSARHDDYLTDAYLSPDDGR
jgi:glycosyltransferase involved in cell wall biosynthesis